MKMRMLIIFIVGVIVGSILIYPAVAILGPSWKKSAVMPVIFVSYDQLYGFRPKGDNSPLAPTWKKSDVVPVALVGYQNIGGKFVPLYTDATIVPAWSKEAVIPWIEVVVDIMGDFIPRKAQ